MRCVGAIADDLAISDPIETEFIEVTLSNRSED